MNTLVWGITIMEAFESRFPVASGAVEYLRIRW